ncbi:MAG: MarR family transcriptional regulator [Acidimicrobiales bacterium]|jgi:DNA-binding MarR family transcriptional regulator|nr:MarR family transcriptional regulator [Acidimicrobiales bacterium]
MADGLDPIAEARRQWEAHGWTDAAPAMAAVTSIMRAQQLFLARVDDHLTPFGLTFARYELLRLLAFTRHGELPLGKLGDRLQVHATSITSAVNRLEGQGFVERRPHPTDGRTTLAVITDSGRDVVERATAVLNAEVFGAIGLSERETAQLYRLLEKVRRSSGTY